MSGAFSPLVAVFAVVLPVAAQIPASNVNMVSGTQWPGGDPFLQRQNEPSMAASSRNPAHLLAGANDYRTVDLPGIPGAETGAGPTYWHTSLRELARFRPPLVSVNE